MRILMTILVLIFWGISAQASFAAPIKLTQTYDRGQLRGLCAAAGGTFSANLDGHTCQKSCTSSSGQEGQCAVRCDAGGSCTGHTPGRLAPTSQRIQDLLGSSGGMVLSQ